MAMVCATPLSVLVVEDEGIVRMLVVDLLREAGFKVTAAEHANEAVKILESGSPNIHVVFSDVHMPGRMTGVDLAAHVRMCWPWIGVMLTSGKAVPRPDGLPEDICLLEKPYALGDVVIRIHEMASSRLSRGKDQLSKG